MDKERREDAHILLDLLLDAVAEVETRRAAFDKIIPGHRAEAEKAERSLQFYEGLKEGLEEQLKLLLEGEEYEFTEYQKNKRKAKSCENIEAEELQPELEELDAEPDEIEPEPEEQGQPQDFAAYWRTHHAF